MSKLDELINKLCPNGVEFKKIEGITKSVNIGINPRRFFKLNPDDATGFYVTVRELNGLKGVNQTEKTDLINDEAIKIIQARANIENGDILFSNTGTVGKMALVDYETLNWGVNEGIYIIKPKHEIINSKFLYYYLDSNLAYADYSRMLTGSTMKHITQKALLSISVPVPPLEVQCEIVRILDNFTLLSAELSAELSARQKQYNFYKDELIKNAKNVNKHKLNEIAEIYDGTHQTPKYADSGIKFISVENISDIYHSNKYISKEDYDKYKVKPKINDVFMTRIGTIGKCSVYSRQVDLAYYVSLALIRPNSNVVNSYYLKYLIESIIGIKELRKRTLVNAVPIKINKEDIGRILLPIPPLEEQERIVNILDKFEKLCNDISEGLPAEIEARKKQYEYYRDKLLTFKELK
ncbi:type I restriction/modification system, S subunit [Campylobacter hyointestinalis subsp. lawsonii CCUG 27631]|uniref:restriction endonuclease subunit S n=1 Tax=Campylobacter hyointestinalis TaxID=198 RepID=UPI0007C9A731|nr:restriction endonuclease subunit S [Campylobacter hyointestinalis]ANE35044.1 type I restriction/modification system, S subunit [Campylobacter hyointestinalis subsp. lawsonii CCUG 27631]